ncbi:MAG: aminopeptidase P family protein [Clostridia bacterium]|nr:aminopeptidase P family protein [Clostridia bacterium]
MTHLQKFQQELKGKGAAALISSHANIFYLCGFSFHDGYLLIFPDAAYLLTDARYSEAAEKETDKGFTVLVPKDGMIAAFRELLGTHGADKLLVEENNLTVATFDRLKKGLEAVTLSSGVTEMLTGLRVCKDEGEIAAIREAQRITDAAFAHILDFIKPGVRELDVALELEYFMRRMGASGLAFDTIAVSGSASSLPHGVPRDCKLQEGFLTMDFGARCKGYCSDMTRTVVIGKADNEMKRLYRTVLAAQEAALDVIGAGLFCSAVDKVARDVIDKSGYEGCFGHSLGHGVGIDIHEAPRLSAKAGDAVLTAGHVVTVEPGIYLTGKYGCRIEDLVVVGADGRAENLTKSPKELIEL